MTSILEKRLNEEIRGLILKSPWIDLILDGRKTWEIRGSNTLVRGHIALIKCAVKPLALALSITHK